MWTSVFMEQNSFYHDVRRIMAVSILNAWFQQLFRVNSCDRFIRFQQLVVYYIFLISPNTQHHLLSMNIAIWRWKIWFTCQYPCFLSFGIFIINLLFIASHNSMQKWLPFAYFKQQFTNGFFSFRVCDNQFPAFWTSPRLCKRYPAVISVTFNVSDNCLRVWQRSSLSNACKSSSSKFFGCPGRSLSLK